MRKRGGQTRQVGEREAYSVFVGYGMLSGTKPEQGGQRCVVVVGLPCSVSSAIMRLNSMYVRHPTCLLFCPLFKFLKNNQKSYKSKIGVFLGVFLH